MKTQMEIPAMTIPSSAPLTRKPTIDLLRGFIIVIMAIDHANAFMGPGHSTEAWGMSFPDYPSLGVWFTRFVTHLCAPGFFLLMGMSMILLAQNRIKKGWSSAEIMTYFLKRGLVIIACMVFLELPGWGVGLLGATPSPAGGGPSLPGAEEDGFFLPTTVLFGLGICMIVGGGMTFFKKWQLLVVTVLSFVFSGWVISDADPSAAFNALQNLLFMPGKSSLLMVLYPLIPWLGVTTFGMFWAKMMESQGDKSYPMALKTGIVFVALFFAIRFLEWGNFQRNEFDDFITFFTLIKYPPSIAFALLLCGLNLVLFYLFSKVKPTGIFQPIRLFGQTAMFFYLVHLYVYGLIGYLFPTLSLPMLYLVWLVGLVPMYYLCRWYLGFKGTKGADSFWRMF